MEQKATLAGEWFVTDKDRAAIRKWPVKICRYIINRLRDNVTMINASGISYLTCPFCNYHWSIHRCCDGCEWGKNHGFCGQDDSELHRLKNGKDFTNKFYRRALKRAGAL